MERLDKIIARRTAHSRKDARRLCKRGRVSVGGEITRDASARVDPGGDIRLDGEPLEPLPLFVMYHKPPGVISTMDDEWGRDSLAGVLPTRWRGQLHPVGRLDADTTGLLMFSSDGKLTQYLLHPRRAIEREYIARVEGEIDGEALTAALAAGVETSDGVIPATVVDAAGQSVRLIVTEGKHRMVRRILANAGHPVLELHRVRYGEFELGALVEGDLRALSDDETAWLTSL